jgi:3-phosphoglycerate kinase
MLKIYLLRFLAFLFELYVNTAFNAVHHNALSMVAC